MQKLAINNNGTSATQLIDTFSTPIRQPSDTCKTTLLKAMFLHGEITAAQTQGISNANKDFGPLERMGIIGSRLDNSKKGLKWRRILNPKKAISYILLFDKDFGTRKTETYMLKYQMLFKQIKAENDAET